MMRDRPMSASSHGRVYGLGPVRFARASVDRELPRYASDTDTRSLPNFSGAAQCAEASPLAFCERFRGCQLGNPPVSEAIVFGVGLGIMAIGEQADNLEAIRRTAAYQDRPRHGPLSLLYDSEAGGARCIGGYFRSRVNCHARFRLRPM